MDLRLFDPDQGGNHQALIWRLVNIPSDFEVRDLGVPDFDDDLRLGESAVVWGAWYDSESSADEAADTLLALAGAVATLTGNLAQGFTFTIGLVQSQIGDYPAGLVERLEQQVDSSAQLGAGAVSITVGDLARHALLTYHDCPQPSGLADPSGSSLRSALGALLGEALGVPLPRLLAREAGCVLPLWEHHCQHEPVADAITAWQDGVVQPERFAWLLELEIRRLTTPPSRRELIITHLTAENSREVGFPETLREGTFLARFAEILGAPDQAPQPLEAIYESARRADVAEDADDDDEVLENLNQALTATRGLLDGAFPAGYADALAELEHHLSGIFAEFPDD